MKTKTYIVAILSAVSLAAHAYTTREVKTVKDSVNTELARARSVLIGLNVSGGDASTELTAARRHIEEAKTNVLTKALGKRTDKALMDVGVFVAQDIVCTSARDVALDDLQAAALMLLNEDDVLKQEAIKSSMRKSLEKILQADKKRVEIWGVKKLKQ